MYSDDGNNNNKLKWLAHMSHSVGRKSKVSLLSLGFMKTQASFVVELHSPSKEILLWWSLHGPTWLLAGQSLYSPYSTRQGGADQISQLCSGLACFDYPFNNLKLIITLQQDSTSPAPSILLGILSPGDSILLTLLPAMELLLYSGSDVFLPLPSSALPSLWK